MPEEVHHGASTDLTLREQMASSTGPAGKDFKGRMLTIPGHEEQYSREVDEVRYDRWEISPPSDG